ncbi:hypothetical protein M6B22_20885 [Jatrophihabitans cynanchi]|jgi:hypothetical protein|uniref:DUF485 domain-containing protein n=1 Tax=Jatrophihabitans cynanchi TaxID=2944128 RepID=A0ABY7K0Q1_9ACTN|nr:hypothetical protein [Jatrophihabitans sp. SB3-54]WAX56954.1 hypothetical protein M6B22_20885 [Jatrophihabitans sp. SB3-54]
MSEPVKRVRITHPRTEAARRGAARPPVREIDEQTALGEVYMRSLIRSQRRLAVTVCGGVGVLLVGIALAGALAPRFATVRVLGLPLPWLLLGVLIYPALIALAAYAVRQAERNEQAFTDLVRKR